MAIICSINVILNGILQLSLSSVYQCGLVYTVKLLSEDPEPTHQIGK